MSELTTKLHVKQNDTIYEVTVYDNAEEATPEGGNYLNVFNPNNNETGYIGLWPKNKLNGGDHTPLSITKNNTEYWLECTVSNNKSIIIIPSNLGEDIFVNKEMGTEFQLDSNANTATVTIITNENLDFYEIIGE